MCTLVFLFKVESVTNNYIVAANKSCPYGVSEHGWMRKASKLDKLIIFFILEDQIQYHIWETIREVGQCSGKMKFQN